MVVRRYKVFTEREAAKEFAERHCGVICTGNHCRTAEYIAATMAKGIDPNEYPFVVSWNERVEE